MEEIIMAILGQIVGSLIDQGIKYVMRKATDSLGNVVTNIISQFDDDGDGIIDREEVVYTIDNLIPDLSGDYTIVNRGEEIGIGLPEFEIVPASEFPSYLEPTVTGNDKGLLVDGDVYCPLPLDYDGDGSLDWGKILDLDHNGIPDASDDAPFYPAGSNAYNTIINNYSQKSSDLDIILVSSDGEIAIYDRNGNIKQEDVDTAYATWVSENGIMNKPLDNYSVTEGLLFLSLLMSLGFFIRSLFKRKDYYR